MQREDAKGDWVGLQSALVHDRPIATRDCYKQQNLRAFAPSCCIPLDAQRWRLLSRAEGPCLPLSFGRVGSGGGPPGHFLYSPTVGNAGRVGISSIPGMNTDPSLCVRFEPTRAAEGLEPNSTGTSTLDGIGSLSSMVTGMSASNPLSRPKAARMLNPNFDAVIGSR